MLQESRVLKLISGVLLQVPGDADKKIQFFFFFFFGLSPTKKHTGDYADLIGVHRLDKDYFQKQPTEVFCKKRCS